MYDLHCHASFSADPATFASLIEESTLQVLSATITPDDYALACALFGNVPHIRIALGLHPWQIDADEATADEMTEKLLSSIGDTGYIGEVGLDFSPKHAHTKDAQLRSFERILSACAKSGNKVITIHSVRAASDCLDLIEETRCIETCSCIMHWFSGSSDELARAIKLGCYFSVGERSLKTKRGPEYVRAIPEGRLLLETDLPEDPASNVKAAHEPKKQAQEEFNAICASLDHALESILGLNSRHSRASIEAASEKLLARKV
ncbi:MAG: TatD family hydrolase [Eggerthellaceae bacterium]|nr:TatD family hydrolase [Eggerthellaceae bacterium]